MTKSIVVVGNGMASVRFLQEFFARDAKGFAVTVIGAEAAAGYNRILLSPVLAGEIGWTDVQLKPAEWYADLGIALVTGDAVTALDAAARTVSCASGRALSFDACVLATGSDPIRLPIPGADLPGVVTFRTAADVAAMIAAAESGAPAVVIGGGLLGIEAACGLSKRGVKVSLIHLMDRLMERQLDPEAAGLLAEALRAKGIEVLLGAQTEAILGQDAVHSVTLKDGRVLPCGLLVMAAGVRPRTALAKAAGFAVNRGVLVDDQLTTSSPNIYAIGECAEHRGACYGLVEPAYEQAATLAAHLAGEAARYAGSIPAANLKVSGVPVFSAGDFEGAGAQAIILRDDLIPAYRKLVIRDGRLVGAVLYGDTDDALWFLDLIRSGEALGARRSMLAFGRAYAEAA